LSRILFCGDETPASLATVRALHAAGHELFAAVANPRTYVARSRFTAGVDVLADPYDGRSAEAIADEVAALAARRRVDVVLPGTDGILRALTGREERLPAGVVAGTSTPEALERAMDKACLADLAAAAGLDVLPATEVGVHNIEARAGELRFPAVAKPRCTSEVLPDGRLRRSAVQMVDDAGALRRLVERDPERRWYVQRRVEGTLAAICGVAWNGEVVCAVHQVSPRTWPPTRGITAFACTVPRNSERERAVARLVASVGWSGLFGLQFLLTGDGAYPIDFNARMYGSIGLAIAAGLNLPAIWTDLVLGRTPAVGDYRPGVAYRVEEDDPRALLWLWAHGQRRQALRGALPRRRTAHAVFEPRDPLPATVTVSKLVRRLKGQ
jgi:predicted ATP-grasp superfamily ATP-dependent carboligase